MEGLKTYSNESAEYRGLDLETVYSKLLDGKIVGGENDEGVDIILYNNPNLPLLQVKSSIPIAQKFLAVSIKKNEFIPIVIGDPGRHSKDEILESLIKNGGWVGIDQPNRIKIIENIKKVREYIFENGGSFKEV